MGFIIFLNFSALDFATPGFIEKGIVLQNVAIRGGSSVHGIMNVNEIDKPYLVILSDNDSPTKFDVNIEDSKGGVIHNTIFEKGMIRFTPDVKGDYLIYVKNQSGESTSISMSYGMYYDYTPASSMMTALGVLLFIGGSYLILHKHFIKVNTWFKPNYVNKINDDL